MIEVRDSHIHGKGLFARTTITEGTLIGEVQGKPVETDGPHVLWIEEGVSAIEVENEFRFINHDKDPNAAYYDDLTVVALRDIEHGEEITHDYGEDWEPVASQESKVESQALETDHSDSRLSTHDSRLSTDSSNN